MKNSVVTMENKQKTKNGLVNDVAKIVAVPMIAFTLLTECIRAHPTNKIEAHEYKKTAIVEQVTQIHSGKISSEIAGILRDEKNIEKCTVAYKKYVRFGLVGGEGEEATGAYLEKVADKLDNAVLFERVDIINAEDSENISKNPNKVYVNELDHFYKDALKTDLDLVSLFSKKRTFTQEELAYEKTSCDLKVLKWDSDTLKKFAK